MTLPAAFHRRFSLPVIVAPMFLVSGPELVIASCTHGVAGTFPALNARPSRQYDDWLTRIDQALARFQSDNGQPGGQLSEQLREPLNQTREVQKPCAPYGVNLIVHASNPRLMEDTAITVSHRVPFVITSLGHPGKIVEAVHSYGGLVFSDVISATHARKAMEAGVDGIIAIAAGAGGHAGVQSAFSLVREIREFWDGCLILGGAISDGYGIRAAQVLGADLAYMGTRFIATAESYAQPAYKQMIVSSQMQDIVYTNAISGANANFLAPSLEKAGYEAAALEQKNIEKASFKNLADEAKAWRDVWSAGHGVANIHEVLETPRLIARLKEEYDQACLCPLSDAVMYS